VNYRETRILAVERRFNDLDNTLRGTRQAIYALRQRVAIANLGLGGVGCAITYNFTVTDSSSAAALSGATVKVLSSTGSVVATGTTDGSGKVSLVVSGVDSYTYSVADSGYTTATGTLSATCGAIVAVPVAMSVAGCTTTFTGSVITSCNSSPVPSGAVTITDRTTGAVYYTGTTDSSGNFSGTWTSASGANTDIKVTSADGLRSYTLAGVAQTCSSSAVYNLTPNWLFCGGDDIPNTLHGSYSLGFGSGTVTLTGTSCSRNGVGTDGTSFSLLYGSPGGGTNDFYVSYNNTSGGSGGLSETSIVCSPLNMQFTDGAGGTMTITL
jgi:hypothetical protein